MELLFISNVKVRGLSRTLLVYRFNHTKICATMYGFKCSTADCSIIKNVSNSLKSIVAYSKQLIKNLFNGYSEYGLRSSLTVNSY